jgi:hypothetical protein
MKKTIKSLLVVATLVVSMFSAHKMQMLKLVKKLIKTQNYGVTKYNALVLVTKEQS